MFKTQFDKRQRIVSDSGSPVKKLYLAEYDKDGILRLKENGTKNIYSEIQSHKDACLIKNILKRYAEGDYDALNRAQTAYLDVSEMPKNMAEMFNLTIKAENDFNSLPVEIRAKFGHNFSNWLATSGTEAWATAMGFEIKPTEPVIEPVKKEEKTDA